MALRIPFKLYVAIFISIYLNFIVKHIIVTLNMHSFKIISTTILIIFLSSFTTLLAQVSKPNVIMIISDDLNDYIGTMDGHPQVSTPNIDRLAQMGTTFMNTYASASGCRPSRCSIFRERISHILKYIIMRIMKIYSDQILLKKIMQKYILFLKC